MSGDDPVMVAGYLTCHECGGVSWPVDAVWAVPGALVLARYDATHEPGCPRRRVASGVILVDAAPGAEPGVPEIIRPRRCRGGES